MKHFAVIGNPIEHSLSPLIHQANFKALNLDWTYEKILVEDISKIRELIKEKDLSGLNVTIPHKIDVVKCLDEVHLPKYCQAVNTILVRDDKLIGYNTDIYGFFKDLEENKIDVEGKKILILGYGGLGQTLANVFRFDGPIDIDVSKTSLFARRLFIKELVVANRTKRDGVDVEASLEQMLKMTKDYDLVINTLKIGLLDDPGLLQVFPKDFNGWFYDATPKQTGIVSWINENTEGKAIDGRGMLVHQGAKSFEIWTDGIKANVEEMKRSINLKV